MSDSDLLKGRLTKKYLEGSAGALAAGPKSSSPPPVGPGEGGGGVGTPRCDEPAATKTKPAKKK